MQYKWLLLTPLLAGCATPALQPATGAELACRHYYQELDRAVHAAAVRDYGSTPIPGFPYLRVDRFLASFAEEVTDAERFTAWAGQLARLDREARHYEIANLPASAQRRLAGLTPDGKSLVDAADTCREQLVRSELALPDNRDRLRKQAQVPDNYVTSWRIIGLYPLTALFVKAGIAKWHNETNETFALPLNQLPQAGQWRSWIAAPGTPRLSRSEVAELLRVSADNPLAIPEPNADHRNMLFSTFAPQWIIDTVDENDLPGTPRFAPASPVAQVDTARPAVFRRLSHTRFHGKNLLQLNYIIWFPSRPRVSAFDIYAGKLDGINFRITLNSDGLPLLFDTIHNCGCYHMFFPVSPLAHNTSATGFWIETPLVPQVIDTVGEVPQVYVNSSAHYVQRISFTPQAEGQPYQWDDYARLRSLEFSTGLRRSLFDKHGIIQGSERPERVLLWPMGIRSPGAMRQWGNHPTAFVGRRHFDDPYLIEQLFTLTPEQESSP